MPARGQGRPPIEAVATPLASPPRPRAGPARPQLSAGAGPQQQRLARLRFLATKNLSALLGDSPAALNAACAAAALEPSDSELWASIALLAARLGDLSRARAATERGLGLAPRAVPLRERHVLLLGAVGDWHGALRALGALGRVDPGHPWWWVAWAWWADGGGLLGSKLQGRPWQEGGIRKCHRW
jgi:hypothetical protein